MNPAHNPVYPIQSTGEDLQQTWLIF